MTHEESWNAFIDELRAYVQEHHHFPNKHTNLLSKVKYTRKKINEGTLEEWKKQMFLEVAIMRDMEEYTGGSRKLTNKHFTNYRHFLYALHLLRL